MSKYRSSASYGSHASHGQRMGSGPKAGAPVVVAGGPGHSSSGMTKGNSRNPERGVENAASGSAPKGMHVYKQGS